MSSVVKYWLARYTRDLFRQEPRNVGIFACLDTELQARFFGEKRPGHIDGRALRYRIADPTAYTEWVTFWRRTLESPPTWDPTSLSRVSGAEDIMNYIVRSSKGQYAVTAGGELAGIEPSDSLTSALDYLYRALVADEDFWSIASGEEVVTDGRARLRASVEVAFRDADLLGDPAEPLLSRGKVIPAQPVKGTAAEPHRPDFVQENGRLYVMAVVDFATTQLARAKDHAGSAAYIFRDLGEAHGSRVTSISLVRQDGDDDADVRWGLEVLGRHSTIVDWDSAEMRDAFIAERKAAITGAA